MFLSELLSFPFILSIYLVLTEMRRMENLTQEEIVVVVVVAAVVVVVVIVTV
jgi:hypothetical protein